MKERIRGYAEAMKNAGLDQLRLPCEIKFTHSLKDFETSFKSFHNKNKNIEAILCANNGLSIDSLYYARHNCIKIPGDLDFFGFDGGDSFDLYSTPLSYVKQPLEEMGKEVVNLLIDLMNGSNKITHIMLDPSLVIRDTAGC